MKKAILTEVTESIESEVGFYQTSLVYGMYEIEKAIFLTDVSHIIQNKQNWIVVNLINTTNLFKTIIGSIYKQADISLQKLLNSIEGIKFSNFGFKLDDLVAHISYQLLLEEILKQLRKQQVSLFITIDKIKVNQELLEFVSIYQVMVRKGYRINLMLSASPAAISELQNTKGNTFLLRSGKINLDSK